MRKTTRRTWALAAGVMSVSLLATACSNDGGSTDGGSTDADGKVTITVATFNDFGYTDELLAEYTEANPNVVVKQTRAAKSEDARTNLTTKLAAGGSGLADIEAIEVDWLPELVQSSDAFADLADSSVEGRWEDWKVQAATTPDGKLIGYGTDIGPEASATAPTCSRPRACPRTASRSRSSSAATTPPGTATSRPAARSRPPRPTSPGSTPRRPSTRAWSTS